MKQEPEASGEKAVQTTKQDTNDIWEDLPPFLMRLREKVLTQTEIGGGLVCHDGL